MRLAELSVANYRNYEESSLRFGEFNVFVGPNAQGKTNLLEAILVLATTRSHRSAADAELIRHGQEYYYVGGSVEDSITTRRIEVTNVEGRKKQVKLDGKVQAKFSTLLGLLRVVFFAPESTVIVKGGPEDRRRFLDALASQVRSDYLADLQEYRRALQQRNESLKQIRDGRAARSLLDAWNAPLIESGARLTERRAAICDELRPILAKQQEYLTQGGEHAGLRYDPNVLINNGDGETTTREQFERRLIAAVEKDVARGTTSVGPHRDDISLTVNGADARRFASQGQQRTLTLALKLSEFEWIRTVTDDFPIMLLDDVTSELDEMRSALLFEALKELPPQVFLTTTNIDDALYGEIPTHVWEVRAGAVKRTKPETR